MYLKILCNLKMLCDIYMFIYGICMEMIPWASESVKTQEMKHRAAPFPMSSMFFSVWFMFYT